MSNDSTFNSDQAANFFRNWSETFTKMAQAAWSFSPETVPPEVLRQMRTHLFQALAQSWEEFMRSPQFLEGLKQMMDNAIAFRKLSTELFSKAQRELGGASQDDLESLALAIRSIESGLGARLDRLQDEIRDLKQLLEATSIGASPPSAPESAPKSTPRTPEATRAKRSGSRRKPSTDPTP